MCLISQWHLAICVSVDWRQFHKKIVFDSAINLGSLATSDHFKLNFVVEYLDHFS